MARQEREILISFYSPAAIPGRRRVAVQTAYLPSESTEEDFSIFPELHVSRYDQVNQLSLPVKLESPKCQTPINFWS
jgi:hypothetical protein